ncbi:hypothetical protein A7J71_09945 [Achromobacter insolitus]|uniref:hypothetical protein n=1 Tax=Achromobacter insolitus TaxID=217204 RepID=UPI0007C68DA9|nr:hypothetical protein [Achromobacter insolitus]OAE61635.1 hypothetical protein A7J71_09945 [Achromobacter insolitus]OCZ57881.1 hypothetical protein A7P22_12055 [Achromobacter insolitus]
MGDWYPEAELSISLCKRWAVESKKGDLRACRFYLFGSAIYLDGEQFDALRSDLDIVCVMPDNLSVVDRVNLMVALKARKANLELEMIPQLHRDVCDEPGVSIVALTPFEVAANIHKSGARSFFDKNLFFDLTADQMRFGLEDAGTSAISEPRRQALEFCQKLRNDFLAVSANDTGGLSDYRGLDPMPKALTRCAAQIAPDLPEGAWYDTRHGLEYLFEQLAKRRTDHPKLQSLYKRLSIRRGGKGQNEPLSADDQLLLSELMFDHATDGGTEEVVAWEVRIGSSDSTGVTAQQAFEAIRRLVPDARLRGSRQGSIILMLSSSVRAFEMFEVLFKAKVLKDAIGLEVLEVRKVVDGERGLVLPANSHLKHMLDFIESWQPRPSKAHRFSTISLAEDLKSAMVEQIEKDPALAGGIVLTGAQMLFDPLVDVRYASFGRRARSLRNEMTDLIVTWGPGTENEERIGIEVSVATDMHTLYKGLEFMNRFPFPSILVVFAGNKISALEQRAIDHLRKVNPNVYVALKDLGI